MNSSGKRYQPGCVHSPYSRSNSVISIDLPKSVRNRFVIKAFGDVFMLSRSLFWFSVGVVDFVKGLVRSLSLSYFESHKIEVTRDVLITKVLYWVNFIKLMVHHELTSAWLYSRTAVNSMNSVFYCCWYTRCDVLLIVLMLLSRWEINVVYVNHK